VGRIAQQVKQFAFDRRELSQDEMVVKANKRNKVKEDVYVLFILE